MEEVSELLQTEVSFQLLFFICAFADPLSSRRTPISRIQICNETQNPAYHYPFVCKLVHQK